MQLLALARPPDERRRRRQGDRRRRHWRARVIGELALQLVPRWVDLDDDDPPLSGGSGRRLRCLDGAGWLRRRRGLPGREVVAAALAEQRPGLVRRAAMRAVDRRRVASLASPAGPAQRTNPVAGSWAPEPAPRPGGRRTCRTTPGPADWCPFGHSVVWLTALAPGGSASSSSTCASSAISSVLATSLRSRTVPASASTTSTTFSSRRVVASLPDSAANFAASPSSRVASSSCPPARAANPSWITSPRRVWPV